MFTIEQLMVVQYEELIANFENKTREILGLLVSHISNIDIALSQIRTAAVSPRSCGRQYQFLSLLFTCAQPLWICRGTPKCWSFIKPSEVYVCCL